MVEQARWTSEQTQTMRNHLESGKTMHETATLMGIRYCQVKGKVRRSGIALRPRGDDETDIKIREHHALGLSDRKIGLLLGRGHQFVERHRRRLGLPRNNAQYTWTPERHQELMDYIADGKTLEAIASLMGLGYYQIKGRVRRVNISLVRRGWTQEQNVELSNHHAQGLNDKQIAAAMGMSQQCVHRHRNDLGLAVNSSHKPSKWTPEQAEMAINLSNEGYSRNIIADRLNEAFGVKLSRSAVIAYLSRLGVKPRTTISKSRTHTGAKRSIRQVRSISQGEQQYSPRIIKWPTAPVPSLEKRVHLMGAKNHHCRFICDDPSEMLFCGEDVVEGHSWCAYHCSIVFQQTQPRMFSNYFISRAA